MERYSGVLKLALLGTVTQAKYLIPKEENQ